MWPEGTEVRKGWRRSGGRAAAQHLSLKEFNQKVHYWLPLVNWEISSGGNDKLAMAEASTKVMDREYLAESPEPASANPLEYWSCKAAIWPHLSCAAMSTLSCFPPMSRGSRCSHIWEKFSVNNASTRVDELVFLKVSLLCCASLSRPFVP